MNHQPASDNHIPVLAIVGRPNVGKSTLFNRLAGKRLALVDDMPGLTRDRKEIRLKLGNRTVRLLDTAGLETGASGSIQQRMLAQSTRALEEADLVIFVTDAQQGITGADENFADLIRKSDKPVILAANKTESRASNAGYYESFRLGLGEAIAISAEHGLGIGELLERVGDMLEETSPDNKQTAALATPENSDSDQRPVRLAIIGRPNAGKSTLVNALLGAERMITGPEPGLTRDAVASDLDWRGLPVRLYDTAGLRRKSRVKQRAETLSVSDALRAIKFSEVVLVMLDAGSALEKQDLTIADLAAREGRAVVIAVNKWDQITRILDQVRRGETGGAASGMQRHLTALRGKQGRITRPEHYLAYLQDEIDHLLPQLTGVPVVPISALNATGLKPLHKAVARIYELWQTRIPTAKLNRFLNFAQERHPPPAVRGRRIRLRYMTQASARPPAFVVFSQRASALPASYRRYLINGIRETFDLPGVPIRLHIRKSENPYASD